MKNNALTYSLKVWITGLLLGSVVMISYVVNGHYNYASMFFFLILVMFFGLFYSLPSLILLFLLAFRLNKTTLGVIYKKLILSVNGLVLSILTFLFMLKSRLVAWPDFRLAVPYAIVIAIGAWLYKLDPPFDTIEDTISSLKD